MDRLRWLQIQEAELATSKEDATQEMEREVRNVLEEEEVPEEECLKALAMWNAKAMWATRTIQELENAIRVARGDTGSETAPPKQWAMAERLKMGRLTTKEVLALEVKCLEPTDLLKRLTWPPDQP